MRERTALLIVILVVLVVGGPAMAAPPSVATRRAIQALGADHDAATSAVYALQRGGSSAATALLEAWPSLSPLAQRRAIGALRSLAEEHDPAIEALVLGARSADRSVREPSLGALLRIPTRGRDGLAMLVRDPEVGDRAAALLARHDPDHAIPILLDATDAEGGADRRVLRSAIAVAVERASRPEPALVAWLDRQPSPDGVASVSLALRGLVPERVLSSYVRYGLSEPSSFETTWRLLRSAGAAGSDVRIDDWVMAQLAVEEPWMLREAAIDAAAVRGLREAVRRNLSDPYPRVRMRATAVLSGDAPSMLERATLARKDTWPMVRAQAVQSLRGEPKALPVVIAAVDDPMSVVRASAIDVLSDAPHDEGWERVHARLRASNEWPIVTESAIAYVVAHCRLDAAESLFRVVLRAAPSNALTEDLNNSARVIEALRALGTPEAEAVIQRLQATPSVPPTLKMALEAPARAGGGCVAGSP